MAKLRAAVSGEDEIRMPGLLKHDVLGFCAQQDTKIENNTLVLSPRRELPTQLQLSELNGPRCIILSLIRTGTVSDPTTACLPTGMQARVSSGGRAATEGLF